jgi:hypothetical protein
MTVPCDGRLFILRRQGNAAKQAQLLLDIYLFAMYNTSLKSDASKYNAMHAKLFLNGKKEERVVLIYVIEIM